MASREPDDRERDAGRLRDIEERLAALRQEPSPTAMSQGFGHAEKAWRMVIELVAGIVIGGAIGYGLDLAFGTMPLLLVIFLLLGLAAGVNVMIRTAREMGAEIAAFVNDRAAGGGAGAKGAGTTDAGTKDEAVASEQTGAKAPETRG